MTKSKEELKKYFETGDKPTQQQYAELIDSYVHMTQKPGEENRRFVINKKGEVSVTTEKKESEYTLSDVVNNKLSLLKDGVPVKEINLAQLSEKTVIGKRTTYSAHISHRDLVLNKKTNQVEEDIYTDWVDVPLNEGYTASFLKSKLEGKYVIIHGFNISGSSKDNIIASKLPHVVGMTQYFRGGGSAGMQDYRVIANSTKLESMTPLSGFNEFFAVLMAQVN